LTDSNLFFLEVLVRRQFQKLDTMDLDDVRQTMINTLQNRTNYEKTISKKNRKMLLIGLVLDK